MPLHCPGSTFQRRRRSRRAVASFGCLALAVGFGGCQRVGVSPPAPTPSLAACAVPSTDTANWQAARDSAGATRVTYRIPERFVEHIHEGLLHREFQAASEPSGRVMIGFSPSREHYMTLRRAPSPPMHEMSECVTDVDGRQIIFQAWRTEGGRFRGGQRYDLYETLALIPVEPTRTLYVNGGGSGPDFQQIALAVARSVQVERR